MNHPAVAERPLPRPPLPRPESEPEPESDTESLPEPRSQDGLRVSEEDYWNQYYLESDIHYEWNNGRLEEKPVSDYETLQVHTWFMLLVFRFLETRPIGHLVTLDMGFRLRLPGGVVIRKPDFAVFLNDNPIQPQPRDRTYHGVFDLCVETLSDGERRAIERDTVTKKAEYAAGGVPEYFIVHRDPGYQHFYTLGRGGLYVPIAPEDGVIHSRVLPGLQFRLEHLRTQPAFHDLCRDPVYADYLLPGWREADERAAEAVARAEAEAEAARAETEAARADALAAARAELEARLREATEARARAEAELARRQG